jgi:glycosyltransferase involved in cell wall biosynthesis
MKKIVLSTYTFLPDIGGVATNTFTIANAFIDKGYDVTVVTLTKEKCEYDKKFTIIRKPNVFKLITIYLKSDCILFANLSMKLCWPALFINKNYCLHHHSSSAFKKNINAGMVNRIKKFLENKIANNSIHFVNSEFTKRDGDGYFLNRPTYVTYPIANKTKVPQHIIDNYSEKKNAVFVGRIEPEKGVLYLLERVEIIKKSLGINELIFIGSGTLFNSLKEKKLDGVSFVGAQDLDAVDKYTAAASYVFVPSIWQEPFGMVAVEGLVSGAIVISSDSGGLSEALGNQGVLFDINSNSSFENAMQTARKIRNNCQANDYLLEYVESVNSHISKFSSENVIEVIIRAIRSHYDEKI